MCQVNIENHISDRQHPPSKNKILFVLYSTVKVVDFYRVHRVARQNSNEIFAKSVLSQMAAEPKIFVSLQKPEKQRNNEKYIKFELKYQILVSVVKV